MKYSPERISISRKWKFTDACFSENMSNVVLLIAPWNRFTKRSWIKRYHNRSVKLNGNHWWLEETEMKKRSVDNVEDVLSKKHVTKRNTNKVNEKPLGTVRARSKSYPERLTTYNVFISCFKLKHYTWKFVTFEVWKVTSLVMDLITVWLEQG